jgi:hypothetical protein
LQNEESGFINDPRGRIYRPRRFWQDLRAARANRVFRADEKRIRTENTVMIKSRNGLGLHKIVDRVGMCFSSVRNRRSARTASRPRNFTTS